MPVVRKSIGVLLVLQYEKDLSCLRSTIRTRRRRVRYVDVYQFDDVRRPVRDIIRHYELRSRRLVRVANVDPRAIRIALYDLVLSAFEKPLGSGTAFNGQIVS